MLRVQLPLPRILIFPIFRSPLLFSSCPGFISLFSPAACPPQTPSFVGSDRNLLLRLNGPLWQPADFHLPSVQMICLRLLLQCALPLHLHLVRGWSVCLRVSLSIHASIHLPSISVVSVFEDYWFFHAQITFHKICPAYYVDSGLYQNKIRDEWAGRLGLIHG